MILTSSKNFMVIGPVVSEILGGGVVPPPQMLLHCQKEQSLLTVKWVPPICVLDNSTKLMLYALFITALSPFLIILNVF